MTDFSEKISRSKVVLTEGGMVERIRRHQSVGLDPQLAHAHLVYDPKGRQLLTDIYNEYISIGQEYGVPFLSLAPTWRANPERIAHSDYSAHRNINADCVQLMKELRTGRGDYAPQIFIGGMMACKGDAYQPGEALSTAEATVFHLEQAQQLAASGVDFIKAATLPALSEALGIAEAISQVAVPCVLSFVIRPDGTLLDGTPLFRAIERIDSSASQPPLFYMVNCVHPTVLTQALAMKENRDPDVLDRLLGFQANASALSPEELDGLDHLDTSDPTDFARQMVHIHQSFGIKILGGCCGTDARHIKKIASGLARIIHESP